MNEYEVIFSPEAAEDLERLFDHILERELASSTGDLGIPERAIESIQHACNFLRHSPFSCGKAGQLVPVSDGSPHLLVAEATVGGAG